MSGKLAAHVNKEWHYIGSERKDKKKTELIRFT